MLRPHAKTPYYFQLCINTLSLTIFNTRPKQNPTNEKLQNFSTAEKQNIHHILSFLGIPYIYAAQQGFPTLQYIKITKFVPGLSTVFSYFVDLLRAETVKMHIFSVRSPKPGFLDFNLRTHHRPQKNQSGPVPSSTGPEMLQNQRTNQY